MISDGILRYEGDKVVLIIHNLLRTPSSAAVHLLVDV